jgi:hypothetical protein
MQVSVQDVVSTVKNSFNFSVDKFPLSGPDGMRTPWYALFRSDNFEPVGNGSVTSRYVPHQTDDVIALVEAAHEAFDGEIDLNCHFRDGHYVTVAPTKGERRAIFGTADNIFPRVIIRAGYDGKAFSATMGYYRDACRNLAMLRSVNEASVSIRHTSGLRDKMDDLLSTFQTLKQSWATLADVVVELQNREVRMVDFLDQVYCQPDANSKRGVTVHKNRTEAIFKRLARERFQTGRGQFDDSFTVSAWEAFNAVQGYVQHDATRKKNFAGDFDRIILAAKDQKVIAAEKIVMDLIAV